VKSLFFLVILFVKIKIERLTAVGLEVSVQVESGGPKTVLLTTSDA
jgi:hypothetical protein